jgi:hypothetical protein
MGEGFEHLRCPMCGGELIYSEGTHDLCCVRNRYESMSGEDWGAAAELREGRAEYGGGGPEGESGGSYMYKVWKEGEGLRQNAGGSASAERRYPLTPPLSHAGEREIEEKASAGGADDTSASDTPVKGHSQETAVHGGRGEDSSGVRDKTTTVSAPVKRHAEEKAVIGPAGEAFSCELDEAASSTTPVKSHACVFAASFTESSRFGTLWSVRIVHGETNYFALMRLMQKIEKRRAAGEPLAANSPHPPKKREKTRAARLAFRYGIEEEDVYSIKYSSETVSRLAIFYGIPERDVRRIQAEEVEEE